MLVLLQGSLPTVNTRNLIGAVNGAGDRPVIEPRKGKREGLLPEVGCFVFVPDDIRLFLRRVRYQVSKRSRIFLSNCYVFSDGTKARWCLLGPILGAPQAVMVLEKAVALGVRDVVALGWCGSLQESVKIGDVVVPIGFFSEEGTSSHYPVVEAEKIGVAAGAGLSCLKILEKRRIPIHRGVVWTTDAPFRETVGKVLFYKQKGVLAVDMESSALARGASYRGVNLLIILIVSDHLYTLKWHHGLKEAVFKERRKQVIEAVVKALDNGEKDEGRS
ncbi:nucleoside phosphorylase [Thermodesulforhabdus norvegica]|uniref:Uridine phosphorylase n=1 Tax=Thermodesulforhabdus norvegica TaxID=39841 RepID=A0A1I4T9P8_9BACT|nr:nucleoside phosphorylase [Thermodesulforhabdus norvegica]SFM73331.1 Phosphorylase superfamily protein [Thermodesulforhabdus norvegica]